MLGSSAPIPAPISTQSGPAAYARLGAVTRQSTSRPRSARRGTPRRRRESSASQPVATAVFSLPSDLGVGEAVTGVGEAVTLVGYLSTQVGNFAPKYPRSALAYAAMARGGSARLRL